MDEEERTLLNNSLEPEWSQKQVISLIKLYRKQINLWNPKHELYKNRNRRYDSMMSISEAMQIEKSEIERKIKNITSQFYKEKKKIKTKQANSGCLEVNKPKWFAYKYLLFLNDKNTPRESVDNSQIQINTNPASPENISLEDSQTNDVPLNNIENEDSEPYIAEERPSTELFSNTGRKKQKLGERSNTCQHQDTLPDDMEAEALKMFRDIYENKKKCDVFSLLGQEVEMKVRQMPTRYGRCIVTHKIQTILLEAGLGMYDYPPRETSIALQRSRKASKPYSGTTIYPAGASSTNTVRIPSGPSSAMSGNSYLPRRPPSNTSVESTQENSD
ncbi:uncharacterized protein LOC115879991 [Sitophilus oryzae]|uniref:Uncharacterized protein LOC115879991 n=1 Tax=Sitophilus oryzae TaxID=7048 RepID=A0A6J2XQI6_SITOR|nr:uncharacterized protein LOC115879991 [Sitophilus oryzae]